MSKRDGLKITITKDGPYLVTGGVPLQHQHVVTNSEGESLDWRAGEMVEGGDNYALCRCGHSSKKPFCDGTHKKRGFDGSETASRATHAEQAQSIPGPTMILLDAERLCAFGRFCDPAGQVWNLVEKTDHADARRVFEHEAASCPAGRLVAIDRKTGKAVEPQFTPSIGLIHDTARGEAGPLWVRGGIPVESADGSTYEVRNRVTLCRCGASANKPFCDGSHASIHFKG
jgi:CDGSH-type Zn-finger protein